MQISARKDSVPELLIRAIPDALVSDLLRNLNQDNTIQ